MKFSLDLPREAPSIPVIRRVLGDSLRGLGVSDACVSDILVAASEACTNVVRHAESVARYEVVASVDGEYCVLKVADRGRGFCGESEKSAPEEAESGRGIEIMRALVDDVSYDTRPESGTVVYLQKRLSWEDEAVIRAFEQELVTVAS